MEKPSVVAFCMDSPSHFASLRPLISGLARRGVAVHAFTHPRLRAGVDEDGGCFHDLFDGGTREDADSESLPFPCRCVSFAGLRAEDFLEPVRRLQPGFVLYERFALIGPAVATTLGLPKVCLHPNHDLHRSTLEETRATFPQIRISPRCREGVRRLRERHGMPDAEPFSWALHRSKDLNLYAEPPQFLSDAGRRDCEPVEFFGCLPERSEVSPPARRSHASCGLLRLYVSFGSVGWKFHPDRMARSLQVLAEAIGDRNDDMKAVFGLGGSAPPELARALERPNIRVELWADQWSVLGETDLFVTHQGTNSTHEAIYHGVPMLSHPVFGDQPRLARRCRKLGLALPLGNGPGRSLRSREFHSALDEFARRRSELAAALERARAWELETLASRKPILDRLAAAASSGHLAGPEH